MAAFATRFIAPVRLVLAGALAFGLALAAPVAAQQGTQPGSGSAGERPRLIVPRSPILVVDRDRLYSESAYGQQLAGQMQARADEIAAEFRRTEAALAEEERVLTEKRAQMSPDAFRELADEFDEKVTRMRRESEEKAAGVQQDNEDMQRQFLRDVEPVLDGLMREAGSVVILERRMAFVSREWIDITDEAIQRIDAQLFSPDVPGARDLPEPDLPQVTDPDGDATAPGAADAPGDGGALPADPAADD